MVLHKLIMLPKVEAVFFLREESSGGDTKGVFSFGSVGFGSSSTSSRSAFSIAESSSSNESSVYGGGCSCVPITPDTDMGGRKGWLARGGDILLDIDM